MAGSEQAQKLAEGTGSQLDKVTRTIREKFAGLMYGQPADEVDQGQDQARESAEQRRAGGSEA